MLTFHLPSPFQNRNWTLHEWIKLVWLEICSTSRCCYPNAYCIASVLANCHMSAASWFVHPSFSPVASTESSWSCCISSRIVEWKNNCWGLLEQLFGFSNCRFPHRADCGQLVCGVEYPLKAWQQAIPNKMWEWKGTTLRWVKWEFANILMRTITVTLPLIPYCSCDYILMWRPKSERGCVQQNRKLLI